MKTPDIASRQIAPVQPPPDVTINPGKASISISGGQTVQAQFTVEVLSAEGDGIVGDPAAVHVGSLPAGITAELSPQSVVGQGEVTLTLTAAPDFMPTVATVIVSASAGPHQDRSLVTLDVKATGQIRPKYKLLTVIYAPPGTNGNNSETFVTYANNKTTGTTTSIDSSFQTSMDVTASVGDGLDSTDFTASQTTDNTSSVSITMTERNSITVHGPARDGIDHGHDMFVLWLNPLLNVTIDDHVTWELGVDGPPMVPYEVYANWLQDPSLMPNDVAQDLADAHLTTADYAQILACNPFTGGIQETGRFVPLTTTFPYEPPDSPGDQQPAMSYSLTTDTTVTDTTQTTVQYGVSTSVSGPIGDFLASGSSLQWTDTSTFTQTADNTADNSVLASVTIGGPASGYTGPTEVSVYWDTVYSSFMFHLDSSPIPQPQPQNGAPTWQPQGEIAAGTGAPGSQIQFADLTGDGRADYLDVNPDGSVQAWLNGGQSSGGWLWSPAGTIAAGVGAPGSQIQFADLTGDRKADYLNVNPDSSVQEWLNGGQNAGGWLWSPAGTIAAGVGAPGSQIQFADLTGSGRADYLDVNPDGSVQAWLNG